MKAIVGADGLGIPSDRAGRRRRAAQAKVVGKETWYPNVINKLLVFAAGHNNEIDEGMKEEKMAGTPVAGRGASLVQGAGFTRRVADDRLESRVPDRPGSEPSAVQRRPELRRRQLGRIL